MIQQAMTDEAAGNTNLDFSLFASATWAVNPSRHLGRYRYAGNQQQHRLILQAVKPSPWDVGQLRAEVLAATVVDCSGGTEERYLYSHLAQPAMLKPNTEYIVASYESPDTEGDSASLSVEATLGTVCGSLLGSTGSILGNVKYISTALQWNDVAGNNSGIVSLRFK